MISVPYFSGGSAVWSWSLSSNGPLRMKLSISKFSQLLFLPLNFECDERKFQCDATSPMYANNATEWGLMAEYLERILLKIFGIRVIFAPP